MILPANLFLAWTDCLLHTLANVGDIPWYDLVWRVLTYQYMYTARVLLDEMQRYRSGFVLPEALVAAGSGVSCKRLF